MPQTSKPVLTSLEEISGLCDELIRRLRPTPRDAVADSVPPLPVAEVLGAARRQAVRLLHADGGFEPHLTFVGQASAPTVLLRHLVTLNAKHRSELAVQFERVVAAGDVYGRVFMASMVPAPYDPKADAIQLSNGSERPCEPRQTVVIVASTHTTHVTEFWGVERGRSGEKPELRPVDAGEVILLPALEPLLLSPFNQLAHHQADPSTGRHSRLCH